MPMLGARAGHTTRTAAQVGAAVSSSPPPATLLPTPTTLPHGERLDDRSALLGTTHANPDPTDRTSGLEVRLPHKGRAQ